MHEQPLSERSPTSDSPRLSRLSDLLSDFEREAALAHEARLAGRAPGPVTGLGKLDQALDGALHPGLCILHGQPGSGKTALALQVAGTCGCPALLVTCEMGPVELLRRVTARATGTFLGRLKSGEYRPADAVKLARQAIATCPQLSIADATTAYAAPAWLQDAAEASRGDARHLLIVIDSLHSWAEAGAGEANEYEMLNAAVAALRQLAKRLDCTVLAVAERNRASMKEGGLSAGAGTRKLEYSCDLMLDLAVDKDQDDAGGARPVTLAIAKNRNGAAGRRLKLTFTGALQRFSEAER